MSKKYTEPKVMLKSWKRLASFMGVLQNACVVVGKMNDQYNEDTELKGFLLDQSTK